MGGKKGGGAMDAKFDMQRILAGDKEEIERARRLIFRLQGTEVITIFAAVEGSLFVPGHPTADRTTIFASFYNNYVDRNKNPPPDLPLPDSTAEYEDLVQEDIASGLVAERERKKKKKRDSRPPGQSSRPSFEEERDRRVQEKLEEEKQKLLEKEMKKTVKAMVAEELKKMGMKPKGSSKERVKKKKRGNRGNSESSSSSSGSESEVEARPKKLKPGQRPKLKLNGDRWPVGLDAHLVQQRIAGAIDKLFPEWTTWSIVKKDQQLMRDFDKEIRDVWENGDAIADAFIHRISRRYVKDKHYRQRSAVRETMDPTTREYSQPASLPRSLYEKIKADLLKAEASSTTRTSTSGGASKRKPNLNYWGFGGFDHYNLNFVSMRRGLPTLVPAPHLSHTSVFCSLVFGL